MREGLQTINSVMIIDSVVIKKLSGVVVDLKDFYIFCSNVLHTAMDRNRGYFKIIWLLKNMLTILKFSGL